jgi:hypothetical protein
VGILCHHRFKLHEIQPNYIIEDTVQLLRQTEHIALWLKHGEKQEHAHALEEVLFRNPQQVVRSLLLLIRRFEDDYLVLTIGLGIFTLHTLLSHLHDLFQLLVCDALVSTV